MTHSRIQTFIIAFVCIVAIVAVALYTRSLAPAKKSATSDIETVSPKSILAISTSTDWQKQFFEGGSTSSRTITKQKGVSEEENLTATDRFGRDFFTTYVQLRKAGLNNDPTAVQSASEKLIAKSISETVLPTAYTLKNIKILPANSDTATAKKDYGKTILAILASGIPERNEAIIAGEAFDKNDMNVLKDIDPVIAGYKSVRTALLSTVVPQSLAQYHVDILNGFNMALFGAEALRRADVDPLRGLSAISADIQALQSISTALGAMQSYFISAGIPFGY